MSFGFGTAGTLLALAALCGGQELARERAFGLARTEDGEPWAGATVEFLARPLPDDVRVGVPDLVVVTSDERGRFGAAIRPGLAYSVWAWRAEGADSYRTGDVVDGVVPRDAVVLTRQPGLRHRRRVALRVAAGVALPVEVRIVSETAVARAAVLEVDAQMTTVLPPLPPAPATFEVRDAAGVPLLALVADPSRERGLELAVPCLGQSRILVRDIHTEQGASGAFVVVQTGAGQVRIGELAADGCGVLPAPAFGALIAYAEGRAPARANDGPSPARRDGSAWPELREGFAVDRHAHVGPGIVAGGRIGVGDHPAAGAWLAIHEYAMHYSEPNSRSLQPVRRAVQVGPDGRFEIPHLLEEFPPAIDLVLAPEHLAALPAGWRAQLHPVVPLFLAIEEGEKGDGIRKFGGLDLLDLVPVSLRVIDPDGAPALGATVGLLRPWSSITIPRPGADLTVDRSGQLTVLLPREREMTMVVETRAGAWDLFALSTGVTQLVQEPVALPVVMRRPIVVTGRVFDRGGEPVAGHGLSLRPAGRAFGAVRRGAADQDSGVSLARVSDARTLQGVLRARRESRPGRTDAEGRFRFRLPSVEMRYRLDVAGTSFEFDVAGDADPEPLEIEIDR